MPFRPPRRRGGNDGCFCPVTGSRPRDIPSVSTFQPRKLKQPSATQAEIRQIERVRLKVPAVERVYPKFLFTANLIKAQLVNLAEMTEERKSAEVKRMNESSKRRLMLGMQGKKG
ncbi:unnamed protein product [Prunus armeniaca]